MPTYHDVVASPPMLRLVHDGVGEAHCGIADEGGGGEEGQPGEEQLLRVCDVVVGRLLDKVAGRIGCGQGLASGARGGWFGDIRIRIRGGNAADGECDEEEDEQEYGVRVLQNDEGIANGAGVFPELVVVEGGRRGREERHGGWLRERGGSGRSADSPVDEERGEGEESWGRWECEVRERSRRSSRDTAWC